MYYESRGLSDNYAEDCAVRYAEWLINDWPGLDDGWYYVYGKYIDLSEQRGDILGTIGDLRGKDLLCWCPIDRPCHANVLIWLANYDSVTHVDAGDIMSIVYGRFDKWMEKSRA